MKRDEDWHLSLRYEYNRISLKQVNSTSRISSNVSANWAATISTLWKNSLRIRVFIVCPSFFYLYLCKRASHSLSFSFSSLSPSPSALPNRATQLMSQVLCRLASYPLADWASFAVFAFAGKSLMKSWHELDDRVWFSLTNCRVMNFISLRKVTRKKESKKLKKPKKQRIWSFCAALQVVGPKPARSFIWRGEGGKLPSDSVRQKFLYLSPSTTFATAYSKHFPTLARTMCCHRRGVRRGRVWSGEWWSSVRTVPGRAFPLHAKHFWPLSRDRRSQRWAHTN